MGASVIFETALLLRAVSPKEVFLYVDKGWIDSPNDAVWETLEEYTMVYNGTVHTVPEGFITDLASIPRFMWRMYPPSFPHSREASVVHDYIYRLDYENYSKKYADDLLRDVMIHQGASDFTAKSFHKAVSWFGKGGWKK